ncbi:MAG TPA: histidine ammonia-lyase [Thermoanaerobaculia bacterium]|nr:histidine ammonia-lyase [Thermoanaerobaculia bacterium]
MSGSHGGDPVRLRIAALASDLEASLGELRRDPERVRASRARVEAALVDGNAYYGINTGFGILASQRISREQLSQLQHNLILSHAVGVGTPVPREITRLMLRLKIHALGLGCSGVSLGTFQRLLELEERDLVPVVPSRGSLGASGDLAPLAHMSLPLLGRGRVWDGEGRDGEPAREALARCGLEPIVLEAKDGLALINGTQLMSAYGAWVLGRALELVRLVDVVATMSLEALRGSARPFDERIQEVRPHPGQAIVARNVRRLLAGSEILESHRFCGRVQDPYSLRCMPQVHGASRDALAHAGDVVERELNSVTDNPLVFDDGSVISGGNFHGQPLALALDYAAIALAELASISERRTYLLLGGHDGLPLLLMRETGVNSGFMMPQYTAAALVSENKVLCHPASVDSIPTSLGQEDHVSMGSISALKLLDVLHNVEQVIAIELFTAAQALDFRAPLRPGRGVGIAHAALRDEVPHREVDGDFEHDLQLCLESLRRGALLDAVESAVGALE